MLMKISGVLSAVDFGSDDDSAICFGWQNLFNDRRLNFNPEVN
jgi:hypothetical protein